MPWRPSPPALGIFLAATIVLGGCGSDNSEAEPRRGEGVATPSDEVVPTAPPFDCAAVIPDQAFELLGWPTSPPAAVEGKCSSEIERGGSITVDAQGTGRKVYDALCEQLRTGGGTYSEPAAKHAPGQTACASMYDADALVGESTLALLTDQDHVVRVTVEVEQPTSTNRAQWALRRIGEEIVAVW